MQNALLMFIHLMAAGIAVGSTLFSVFILLPLLRKINSPDLPIEESLELKIMDCLAPTVMGCVLTLILTGVYFLLVNYTDQVNLKPGYYNIFGLKMIFVAITFAVSVYQTFALRPRISDLDLRPEKKKQVPVTLKSMLLMAQINLWVISIAIFFGVFLNRF